jgi:hypothetical protein
LGFDSIEEPRYFIALITAPPFEGSFAKAEWTKGYK